MHDGFDGGCRQAFVQARAVVNVSLEKIAPADELPVAFDEVVISHRLEPTAGELSAAVGADVSGTAGDKYFHFNPMMALTAGTIRTSSKIGFLS
jgi:hypothetical protein